MSAQYFPQFSTGTIAQYPVSRSWTKAATVDTLPDGSVIAMATVTPPRISWVLSYSGLSEAEWQSLETLFKNVQGRFGSFTFLDPTDNLLRWSEDFTSTVWTADPLLGVAQGFPDPGGGTKAMKLTNAAEAVQRIVQQLASVGGYELSFSIFLRSDVACTVDLIRVSGAAEAHTAVDVNTSWSRVQMAGTLGAQGDNAEFGIEIPAGISLYVYGAQLESQPAAGAYKVKTDKSGVFPSARFDQDALANTATAPGQFDISVQVTSVVS